MKIIHIPTANDANNPQLDSPTFTPRHRGGGRGGRGHREPLRAIKETIDNQRNFYDIDSVDYFQTNNFGDVNQQYSDNMFKLLSLNIYGINRRLITIPESIELVKSYDLLCFTKTKTGL